MDEDLTTEEKIDLAIATAYTKALAQRWKDFEQAAAAKVVGDHFEKSIKENT